MQFEDFSSPVDLPRLFREVLCLFLVFWLFFFFKVYLLLPFFVLSWQNTVLFYLIFFCLFLLMFFFSFLVIFFIHGLWRDSGIGVVLSVWWWRSFYRLADDPLRSRSELPSVSSEWAACYKIRIHFNPQRIKNNWSWLRKMN